VSVSREKEEDNWICTKEIILNQKPYQKWEQYHMLLESEFKNHAFITGNYTWFSHPRQIICSKTMPR